jgi:hypothetical protein
MSYCHAIAGGSVNLTFHPTCIDYGLTPGILPGLNSCFVSCNATEVTHEVYGCTNPNACNFDALATVSNGTCIFPPPGFNCTCASVFEAEEVDLLPTYLPYALVSNSTGSPWLLDVEMDWEPINGDTLSWPSDIILKVEDPSGDCVQVGGFNTSLGCYPFAAWPSYWSSTSAGHYAATLDLSNSGLSGSGVWSIELKNGYAASLGVRISLSANLGSVCEHVLGCTSSSACNFNAAATDADGSCIFAAGCDYCSSGSVADGDSDNDGVCNVNEVPGCTSSSACNFIAAATDADGSCVFATGCDFCSAGAVVDGDSDNDGVCDIDEVAGCMFSTACNFNAIATDADGSCVFATGCDFCSGGSVADGDTDNDGVCNDVDPCVGALDACGVCNGPGAIYACGCTMEGCTYCPGDFNDDGLIGTSDLLLLLSEFGCMAGCSVDADYDGITGVGDILILLSAFGTNCSP